MGDFKYITLTREQYTNLLNSHKSEINRLENENNQLKFELKNWKKVNLNDYTIQVYWNDQSYFYTNEEVIKYLQTELVKRGKDISELKSKINIMQIDLYNKLEIINDFKYKIDRFKHSSWFKKIKFKF